MRETLKNQHFSHLIIMPESLESGKALATFRKFISLNQR